MTEPKRDEAPLPWWWEERKDGTAMVFCAPTDVAGSTCEGFVCDVDGDAGSNAANAKHIVRAVNGERALREALRLAVNTLEALALHKGIHQQHVLDEIRATLAASEVDDG